MTSSRVPGAPAALEATIGLRLGGLDLDLALEAHAQETVVVLGPNGAGKTTLLRCLAGLQSIDRGHIRIAASTVDDPAAARFVPPETRAVGVVFQDYLLFAHLDALENVMFGLRARGLSKRESRSRATEWLERLGLADQFSARPRELSGGQAQRVALARALVTDPALLLLDEPLAALDASTRDGVRSDLRRHLDEFDGGRLIVTHDPVDAYVLADRVVVIEEGSIVQSGSLADITSRPRSAYVAHLVGSNLLSGVLHGERLVLPSGAEIVVAPDGLDDGPVLATVAPSAVALHRQQPAGSPRNVWVGTVAAVDHFHHRVRVTLAGPIPIVAEITPGALHDLQLRPGDPVWAAVKATEIVTYPT